MSSKRYFDRSSLAIFLKEYINIKPVLFLSISKEKPQYPQYYILNIRHLPNIINILQMSRIIRYSRILIKRSSLHPNSVEIFRTRRNHPLPIRASSFLRAVIIRSIAINLRDSIPLAAAMLDYYTIGTHRFVNPPTPSAPLNYSLWSIGPIFPNVAPLKLCTHTVPAFTMITHISVRARVSKFSFRCFDIGERAISLEKLSLLF